MSGGSQSQAVASDASTEVSKWPTVNADRTSALSTSGGERLSPARRAAAIVPLLSNNAALRWLADLDQISEVLRALKQPSILGQWWGQLDFVSITFHSAIRFPPPPPTSCDVCRRLATAMHLNLTPQRRVP